MAPALLLYGLAMLAPEPVDLPNASFEEVAEGRPARWMVTRGEAPEVRTDGAHAGARYVRLSDPRPDDGVALQSALLPARPGGAYELRGWLRTSDRCQPGLYVQFHADDGQRLAETHARATGPTEGWVEVVVSATAPAHAEFVSVLAYGFAADVGAFDVDDLTLTVEGGAAPASSGVTRAATGDKTMLDIGSRRELFIDAELLDGLSGEARRVLHHPTPQNDALRVDQPWEGQTSAYLTVFRDGDRVRLYYRGSAEKGGEVVCLAESPDGVTFTRPELGLVEHAGAKANNIVWKGPGSHNFSPFRDPNPAAPADQRYKAVGGGPLLAFASPDGVQWRQVSKDPIITKGAFDSHNLAFWDTVRQQYVCYFRIFADGVRAISRATSPDFVTWSEPEPLTYGEIPPEHLYTNNILPYERAPHLFIGLPARFVPQRRKDPNHPEVGVSDGVLMASRDGLRFERWREGFLVPGPDPLSWTDRTNYPAWGLVQTSPTELSLYWTHHYRHPDMTIRRGTIRLDGFVSVYATMAGGQMLTRPLTFAGRRLTVNYATSAAGSARFELCDAAGEPLPGFALADSEVLFGDEVEHTVTWRGSDDLSALAGRPVRLRVQLKDAHLYSFQFQP